MDFNLQDYLTEWRREEREDFANLCKTATQVREDLIAHNAQDERRFSALELALVPLQRSHQEIRWTFRSIIGAGAVAAIDAIGHHLGWISHVGL